MRPRSTASCRTPISRSRSERARDARGVGRDAARRVVHRDGPCGAALRRRARAVAGVGRASGRPPGPDTADDAHRPAGASARLARAGGCVAGVSSRSALVRGSPIPRARGHRLACGGRRSGRLGRVDPGTARRQHDHHAAGRPAGGTGALGPAQRRGQDRPGSLGVGPGAELDQGADPRGVREPGAVPRRAGRPAGAGRAAVRSAGACARRARGGARGGIDPCAERQCRTRGIAGLPAVVRTGSGAAVRRPGGDGAGRSRTTGHPA